MVTLAVVTGALVCACLPRMYIFQAPDVRQKMNSSLDFGVYLKLRSSFITLQLESYHIYTLVTLTQSLSFFP